MERNLNATDDAVLTLIGRRLAALRVAKNLTQRQLAEQAGLGLRTVQRLELGESGTHLSGFVRVCRMLGLLVNAVEKCGRGLLLGAENDRGHPRRSVHRTESPVAPQQIRGTVPSL